MSKSDAEKEALQTEGGVGTLAGGLSIPSDFMDRMTTTIRPEELSSKEFDAYEALDSGRTGGFTPNLTSGPGTQAYNQASLVEAVGKMPNAGDRFGPGGLTTLTGGDFSVGPDFGKLGIGMGDFDPTGGLDPSLPQFQQEKTFGQKAGETVKNFLKRLARVHPATATAAFAYDFVKGLQNAESPQDFVKGVMGQLAMRKVGSNLGLSGLQKQGVGSLINMARGKQNLSQTIKGLGTSAAFQKAAPSIFKSAYDKGGMNGVYAAATALSMAQKAAMRRAMQPGPGGDG